MPSKHCEQCGVEFEFSGRGKAARFCCERCRGRFRRGVPEPSVEVSAALTVKKKKSKPGGS